MYLQEIDEGRSPIVPAPSIARRYRKMADDATLRDVVRADEAHHRADNHGFADILRGAATTRAVIAPYSKHATELQTGWRTPSVAICDRLDHRRVLRTIHVRTHREPSGRGWRAVGASQKETLR